MRPFGWAKWLNWVEQRRTPRVGATSSGQDAGNSLVKEIHPITSDNAGSSNGLGLPFNTRRYPVISTG